MHNQDKYPFILQICYDVVILSNLEKTQICYFTSNFLTQLHLGTRSHQRCVIWHIFNFRDKTAIQNLGINSEPFCNVKIQENQFNTPQNNLRLSSGLYCCDLQNLLRRFIAMIWEYKTAAIWSLALLNLNNFSLFFTLVALGCLKENP